MARVRKSTRSLPARSAPSGPGRPARALLPPAATVVALLALAVLLGCFRLWDTDVWWHLRTGQLIWRDGAVPRTDWFTYTNSSAAWIDLHWGFQLVLAGLFALGGVPSLVLFKAALGALTVGVALLARRPGWSLDLACLLWIAPLFVLTGRLYERPELFTLLFLAVFLTVLFHAGQRPRLLWLLPVVQVFWVNTHGLFILGPLVLLFYVLDRGAAALLPADRRTWLSAPGVGPGAAAGSTAQRPGVASGEAGPMLPPAAVTVAACLLNPYLERGALFPLELFGKISGGDDFYRRTIGELQGVGDFLLRHGVANPYVALWVATLALAAASFVVLLARRRISLFRLLLFFAFAYLGWQAKRNSNIFALVLGAVSVWNFSDALALRTKPSGQRKNGAAARWRWARPVLVVLLAVLAVLVVTNRFYEWAGEGRRFGVGERSWWFAHEAARFLGRDGAPGRAYVSDLGQAAVYLFHNGPDRKVFADPRLEVNSRDVIERYIEIGRRMAAADSSWERLLGLPPAADRGGDFPALLLDTVNSREMIAGLLPDSRWRVVHVDPLAVVFLTRERADALGLKPLPLTEKTIPWPPD